MATPPATDGDHLSLNYARCRWGPEHDSLGLAGAAYLKLQNATVRRYVHIFQRFLRQIELRNKISRLV